MKVLEDANQALIVNLAVLAFDNLPGAELFPSTLYICVRVSFGVGGLLALAVGVELFTKARRRVR